MGKISVYFITNETADSETKPVEDAYTSYLDPKQPRDFVLIFLIQLKFNLNVDVVKYAIFQNYSEVTA